MWFRLVLAIVFILSLAGCATTRKEAKDTHIQQLKMQIEKLNSELQRKKDEIYYLEGQLTDAQSQRIGYSKQEKNKELIGKSINMTPKNIQTALKNAGFYNGAIDGKIGKETTKAIMKFQKANGLADDGIVGKETWLKLKKYL